MATATVERLDFKQYVTRNGRVVGYQLIQGWGVRVDGALMAGNDAIVSTWKKSIAQEIADSFNGGTSLLDRVARSIATGY